MKSLNKISFIAYVIDIYIRDLTELPLYSTGWTENLNSAQLVMLNCSIFHSLPFAVLSLDFYTPNVR